MDRRLPAASYRCPIAPDGEWLEVTLVTVVSGIVMFGIDLPFCVGLQRCKRGAQANLKLEQYWAQLGAERAAWDTQGLFCYNVFSVSEADYRRLCEMHLAYFEELRAIVSRSQPEERVVVANLQMFAIDSGPPAPPKEDSE